MALFNSVPQCCMRNTVGNTKAFVQKTWLNSFNHRVEGRQPNLDATEEMGSNFGIKNVQNGWDVWVALNEKEVHSSQSLADFTMARQCWAHNNLWWKFRSRYLNLEWTCPGTTTRCFQGIWNTMISELLKLSWCLIVSRYSIQVVISRLKPMRVHEISTVSSACSNMLCTQFG